MNFSKTYLVIFGILAMSISCDKDDDNDKPKDPDQAEVVSVDRFSDAAGTLMKRSADASLPGINEPIDFLNHCWRNPEMELVSEFLCGLVNKKIHK